MREIKEERGRKEGERERRNKHLYSYENIISLRVVPLLGSLLGLHRYLCMKATSPGIVMQPDVDPQYRSTLEVSFGFQEPRHRAPLEHSRARWNHYTEPVLPLSAPLPLIPLSADTLSRGVIVLPVVETLDCRFIVDVAFEILAGA